MQIPNRYKNKGTSFKPSDDLTRVGCFQIQTSYVTTLQKIVKMSILLNLEQDA